MKTRIVALTLAVLALAGCGDWSNEDLEFLVALPDRAQLEARVPDRTASGLGGTVQRKDGLSVGAHSAMYEKTVVAGRNFNSVLFALLELVENVTQRPPTTRAEDQRIWGPVVDRNHLGREVRLVVTRVTDPALRFDWSIEAKRRDAADDAWVTLVGGWFLPSGDLSRGTGELTHDAAAVREGGFAGAGDDPNLRSIQFEYDTRGSPRTVQMHLQAMGGATLDSAFLEEADGDASLVFELRADFVPGPFPQMELLTYDSRWVKGGAGRTDAWADEGDVAIPTDVGSECWDGAFDTVWFEETYDLDGDGTVDGTAGDPSACAVAP